MVKVEVGVLPDLMSMQMESWPSEIGNQRIVDAGESFTVRKYIYLFFGMRDVCVTWQACKIKVIFLTQ